MVFKFLKSLLNRDSWITEEPVDLNDEKNFGMLASDIGRRTGIFPGFIQIELERMVTMGNPLAAKFTELARGAAYSPFDDEFDELCGIVRKRLELRTPK